MKKGFTLIELLVVVLIIAILAAVALPQYTKTVEKARITNAIAYVKAVKDAQERYYLANDEYADSMDKLDISMDCPSTYTCAVNDGSRVVVNKTNFTGQNAYYIVYRFINSTDQDLNGKMYCSAAPANVKADALCQSFGGTNFYNSVLNRYVFN
ncbi:type II secretion system protein G [Parelusimicrobium proximum]|uniref:type IV pilin protein n=1 Tax=Parelusimicrobium proximum TaxID=3228953 RepID=UPI003D172ADB